MIKIGETKMGYYADLIKEKQNSKEEKDNASVQDRFRHKGCMITILKKGENQYTFTIEQSGREEGTNATYPTQDKAESEAKREVEANWNEKEEGHYAKLSEEKKAKRNALEPVKRAEQLAREGKQYAEIIEAIKKEYNLPTDKATRAADQGKRNYELNPINGEHKKPAKI